MPGDDKTADNRRQRPGDKHPGGDGDRTNFHCHVLHGDQHQRHQIERNEHDRVHDHRQAEQNRLVDVKHRGPRAQACHFAHVFTAGENQHRNHQRQRGPCAAHPDHVKKLFGNNVRWGGAGLNGGDVIGLVLHPQRANNAVDHRTGVNAHRPQNGDAEYRHQRAKIGGTVVANRGCHHLVNKLVDGVVVGVFKADADNQHQDHHQQGRDQRRERLLHRRRHAIRHSDNQFFALQPAEQLRPKQGTNHRHE